MIAGMILAAGEGRRFGGPKQVARVDGEPLCARACRAALEAELDPVIVIVGAHARLVERAVGDLPVALVANPAWRRGLSSSIRCGIDYLGSRTSVGAVAIVLADQVLVDGEHLRALSRLRAARDYDVAATRYGDVVGVPAVFARSSFPLLRVLEGDRGAGRLIRDSARSATLPFAGAAIDIDTPADLSSARAIYSSIGR